MSKSFANDLRVARRKSGLTQADCAHLLNVHRTKISHIEKGTVTPSATDIALYSLVFGKTYDALCQTVFETAADGLQGRLFSLPAPKSRWVYRFNRTNSLDNLEARLEAIAKSKDGRA